MRCARKGLTAVLGFMLSAPVYAQDLFSSTNSTTHSYNYLEAQYLVGVDASPPVLATLLLDVTDNASFKAEYLSQDFGDVGARLGLLSGQVVLAEARLLSIGGLYHQPLPMIDQSDWIAGLMFGRAEVEVEAPSIGVKADDAYSFQEIYAGLRKTLGPRLEGEASVNFYRDSNSTDVTADVKLVYRVATSFDIALAGNELGGGEGSNILGIGLRYTW